MPSSESALRNLPRTLYLLRECRGLSQSQLARSIGVRRQSVSRWEIGRLPTLLSLESISAALGVTVAELLRLARS